MARLQDPNLMEGNNFMKVQRVWCMPNKWTFSIKPIKLLINKYMIDPENWVDPFAGIYSEAGITNDIENRNTSYNLDALIFLKSLPDKTFNGVLFDPPYSVEQCLRKYTPKQKGTAGRAEYWSKCKNEIARILKQNGTAISFGWDSTGIGKTRGFYITEILLICHGACHNDTIVTVDIKKELTK